MECMRYKCSLEKSYLRLLCLITKLNYYLFSFLKILNSMLLWKALSYNITFVIPDVNMAHLLLHCSTSTDVILTIRTSMLHRCVSHEKVNWSTIIYSSFINNFTFCAGGLCRTIDHNRNVPCLFCSLTAFPPLLKWQQLRPFLHILCHLQKCCSF